MPSLQSFLFTIESFAIVADVFILTLINADEIVVKQALIVHVLLQQFFRAFSPPPPPPPALGDPLNSAFARTPLSWTNFKITFQVFR